MISIVIPLFNKESYIGKTIKSVLLQTFPNFEVWVVDDGSTDNSLNVLGSFSDDRIQVLKQQHQGVSAARNNGLAKARFDWVAFLDADDWWDPHFLEALVAIVQLHPELKMVCSGRTRIFETNEERYENPLLPTEGHFGWVDYFEVIARYGAPPINASNALIKKKAIQAVGGFRVGQQTYEDHDLWMRLALQAPLGVFNKNLSYYRKIQGKKNPFSFNDFYNYLQTIRQVYQQSDTKRKHFLERFSTKFIMFNGLKFGYGYDSKERKKLLNTSKSFLPGHYRLLLKTFWLLPFRPYPLLRYFYKSWRR